MKRVNQTEQNKDTRAAGEVSIVVHKRERTLELLRNGLVESEFKIALGRVPVGDKEIEGDGKTPEGNFFIQGKNPKSKYHLGLGVSYPNIEDAERGLLSGVIDEDERDSIVAAMAAGEMPPQKTKLGGEIYIHGGGTDADWTQGCIALDNEDMTTLFENVPTGASVTILP